MIPGKRWYLREPPIGSRYINPFGNIEIYMGWMHPEPKPTSEPCTAIVLVRKENP